MNLPLYGTAAVVDFSVFGLLVPAPGWQASWNMSLAECPQQEFPAASSLQIQSPLTSCDNFVPRTNRKQSPGERFKYLSTTMKTDNTYNH